MTEILPEDVGAANGCKDRTDAPLMANSSFPPTHVLQIVKTS